MKLSAGWTAALAVWATLALGGCEATSGPPEPDPLPGPLIVLVHGLPGPVGFGGEIITWRPGSPPLALTLDGTTTAPPDTLRCGEAVERIALELVTTQSSGTLRVEVMVDSRILGAASTSDPFGHVHIDLDVHR